MLRIGVLASGRGSNLQSIINNIQEGKIKASIKIVISDKKNAQALDRADNYDIKSVFVNPAKYSSRMNFEKELLEMLNNQGVELILLAGFMRILSPFFIKKYRGKIMNIHPSLLPSFPGLHPQRQALDYGVKVSGCTVHFVDEGMDTGPIILQAAVPVKRGDTEETLAARILEKEHIIYPEAVRLYAERLLEVKGRTVKILEEEV